MIDHKDRIKSQILVAAISRFQADRHEALATLDIYLHNPVAIGDHSNILEEVITATKKLAEAEEALASLQVNFMPNESDAPDNDE
jgi:hypothetical protein